MSAESRVQVIRGVGQGKKWGESRGAFDQAKPDRHHRTQDNGQGDFGPGFSDKKYSHDREDEEQADCKLRQGSHEEPGRIREGAVRFQPENSRGKNRARGYGDAGEKTNAETGHSKRTGVS